MMGSSTVSKGYRCSEDCVPSGCPGHTMVMKWSRSSDIGQLWPKGADGERIFLDQNQLETLMDLIAGLSGPVAWIDSFVATEEGVIYE